MNWKPYWIRCIGVVVAALGLATAVGALSADDAEAQPRRRGAQAQAPAAASAEAPAARGSASGGSGAVSGVVNINTATEDELTRLPGIGPAKARAIVQARERNRFRSPEDILRVRGIGRATFRRLAPMLRVDGPTTLQ